MSWMTDIQNDWNAATDKVNAMPTMVTIPDGVHRAALVGVEPDPERPMIRLRLRFLDFQETERTKVVYFGAHPEWARAELKRIDCDGANPQEVVDNLEARLGHVFDISVKTKQGEKYSNMYFNGVRNETIDMGADMFADAGDPSSW